MTDDLEFYFDFSSPYGYFASHQVDEVAEAGGRRAVWKPIMLGAVMKQSGVKPLIQVPIKGEYSRHDWERLGRLFDVPVRDMNSMKAFRREVLDDLQLREDWHRYLVVLAHWKGWKIGEIDIELLPRRHGESKYGGHGRIVVGMLDLVAVWFQLAFSRKPLMFFGVTGLGLLGLGGVTGLVAVWFRVVLGAGFRPLLNLVILLVLLGGLLFVAGLIGELVAGLRAEVDELRRDLRHDRRT